MSKEKDTQYMISGKQGDVFDSVSKFVYNANEGSCLGRTPKSWGQIVLFYICLYILLALLFGASLWVFFLTVDPRIPKWRLEQSIIGTNPGLGFRPMPPRENLESTLIYYKGTSLDSYRYWKESLFKFLSVYKTPGLTPGRGQNIDDCDYDKYPKQGKVCDVDILSLDPCTYENEFNYHKASPCIFLKLNKIYGWVPEYYNSSIGLPPRMPEPLKNHIRQLESTNPLKLNTVWVSCEGENPSDIENVGQIRIVSPTQGFPGYFFPYENSEGYLSPIVAVHIESPTSFA